jgi:replicative DNA helicase
MFSFEMTGKQSVERILASQAYVNMRDLKTTLMANSGQLLPTFSREETEKSKVKHAGASARKWKVEIFEKLKGIEQVTAEMARMKALGGLDVALIDYAQLIRGLRSKGDSREREVASISYEFKQACMRNECLGILLSQLTVDSNGSAHLRESRALGQDASCVLFIEGDGQDKRLRVVAARSAPSGTLIELHWQEEFTKFSAK